MATRQQRRKRGRNTQVRGLPDQEVLVELAKTYLKLQRGHATELGITVPRATQKTLDQMVEAYLRQYSAGVEVATDFERPLSAVYLRYSDENSNPRSLCQQLERTLGKAASEGLFVPWELVFADAALSGTTANRPGYQLARKAVCGRDACCQVLVVDEIGRAARVAIETLDLAQQVTVFGGRLLGVSDSFDSDQPHSKLMLHVYAMLNEWFVDQLRAKVQRGMDDPFDQGKVSQPPAYGYRILLQLHFTV